MKARHILTVLPAIAIVSGCESLNTNSNDKLLVQLPTLTIKVGKSQIRPDSENSTLICQNKSDAPRELRLKLLLTDKNSGRPVIKEMRENMYPNSIHEFGTPADDGQNLEIEELTSLDVTPAKSFPHTDYQDPMSRESGDATVIAKNFDITIQERPHTIHFINGDKKHLLATCLYTEMVEDKNGKENPVRKSMTCELYPYSERAIPLEGERTMNRIIQIDSFTVKEIADRKGAK